MSKTNIYLGPRSCYAKMEGMYAAGGPGVNLVSAASILSLILRDYKRGWTYDHSCHRIPMTYNLFVKRATYLIALAKKHGRPLDEVRQIKRMVEYAIKHLVLPPWAQELVRIGFTRKHVKVPLVEKKVIRRKYTVRVPVHGRAIHAPTAITAAYATA